MTVTASRRRPPVAARRAGYVVSVLVNIALLYVVNGWPGWEAVPFLTQDTQQVMGLVNASIVASLPKTRSAMHLDTVFTFCDHDLVTAILSMAPSQPTSKKKDMRGANRSTSSR